MTFLYIQVFFVVILYKYCFCDAPSQTDLLMKDIFEIEESIFNLNKITNIFEIQNTLSLHTLLTTFDKNIKNVEEAAHIWETMNNSLPNLTIKMDNISKAQDKIDGLYSKLNLMSFKIDNISTTINVFENSYKEINNKLEGRNINTKDTEQDLEALIASKSYDYTFCNSVKAFSGIFRFYTSSINLVNGTRDFGARLCEKGWLVIQKRDSYKNHENFNRSWDHYKRGFGDLRSEFWFGNNFLYHLSHKHNLTLRIELEYFDGNKTWAEYETFKVENEFENYRLTIGGGFNGTAPNSFPYHNNVPFSTFDKRNDQRKKTRDACAVVYGSGWWFKDCFYTNLNGIYYNQDNYTNNNYKGIIWSGWLNTESLKSSKMMVKAKGNLTQFCDLTYKIFYLWW